MAGTKVLLRRWTRAAAAAAFVMTTLSGAAYAQGAEATYDPWEKSNRRLFAVHQGVDRVLLKPIARGYRAVTTKFIRKRVSNTLTNLESPVTFANDVLQLEFGRAGITLSRLVINSTIGLGGMFDPATQMNIEGHREDFGQTLAVYGVGPGPYFIIPGVGPTNMRDFSGLVADRFIDPVVWINDPQDGYIRLSKFGATLISTRESLIDPLDDLEATSIDYYAALRSVYNQTRVREIANGADELDLVPDLDEFEFDDFEELDDFDAFDELEGGDTAVESADAPSSN